MTIDEFKTLKKGDKVKVFEQRYIFDWFDTGFYIGHLHTKSGYILNLTMKTLPKVAKGWKITA